MIHTVLSPSHSPAKYSSVLIGYHDTTSIVYHPTHIIDNSKQSRTTTMDPNDLTDDQKRRMAGQCCFSCLGLTATAAFICAVSSYAYCDFVTRSVQLNEGYTIDSVCADEALDTRTCESLLQTHGIGFEGFWITVPVDTQVCYSYTLLTPR